jgi:hypothetical protein
MPAVYDDVQQDAKGNVLAAFPYIVLGEDTHAPWDTDDSIGSESTITIHVWSRQRGKKETKQIQGLIYEALHRHELEVLGFATMTVEFDYSDVILDADGQTRHGVSRYRVFIEEEASTA